jgi:hypothetical protein
MATIRQIEANRLNAQKSTGPRSVEGKAVVRMNALKTGIDAVSHVIRGENPQALETLTADYYNHWNPATPQARALVDLLIANDWLLRRLHKTEAQIWEREFHCNRNVDYQDAPLGEAYRGNFELLGRLQRRLDSATRTYQRVLRDLERLHPHSPSDSSPAPQPIAIEPGCPQIGFVPQSPAEPPSQPLDERPREKPLIHKIIC